MQRKFRFVCFRFWFVVFGFIGQTHTYLQLRPSWDLEPPSLPTKSTSALRCQGGGAEHIQMEQVGCSSTWPDHVTSNRKRYYIWATGSLVQFLLIHSDQLLFLLAELQMMAQPTEVSYFSPKINSQGALSICIVCNLWRVWGGNSGGNANSLFYLMNSIVGAVAV